MIARGIAGEGGLLFFVGEPGIGKTRLADLLAREGEERGFRVAWGRCWEAGGAPAFWPWSEIFRALGADDPFRGSDDATIAAGAVRFRRFGEARQRLEDISRDKPLLLAFDDLHAADVPSLSFLHMFVRTMKPSRVVVVGTYRDVEARLAGEAGSLLAKIGREGDVFTLARLDRNEVIDWIGRASPDTTVDVARHVHAVTEGNPLFIREILRMGGKLDARRMPDSLRTILDERIARLSPEAAALVEAATVLGRHADVADVAAIVEVGEEAVKTSFEEASTVGILEPTEERRYAFTHVLLRDRLYAKLPAARRTTLHWRAGQRFLRADLATAAHHLLEGRSIEQTTEAATVARDAASLELGHLAFEDAARIAGRAIDALRSSQVENAPGDASQLACELEILRAEALIRAGDIEHGKASCLQAASLARAIGCPILEARAALAYGVEIASGSVDHTMIRLLRGALQAFGEPAGPTSRMRDALRARVMARLAVALMPPVTVREMEEGDALARDAITLARGLDDPDTLLFASYFGMSSTFGYHVSRDERYPVARLTIELATQLDRSVILANASPWWIAVLCERGSRTEAVLALERYAERVRDLPQPQYQWRLPIVRATMAMLDGDYDACERFGREALAIAESGQVILGMKGWALHRIGLAIARGDPGSIAPEADRLLSFLGDEAAWSPWVAWVLAASGRSREACQSLARIEFDPRILAPTMVVAADAAVILRDRAAAARLYPLLEDRTSSLGFFWGSPQFSSAFGPTQLVLAGLAALLRKPEARKLYEAALVECERMGAVPFVALARRGLAALGGPSQRPSGVSLVHEGDMWLITSSTGTTVRLKDSKGLHYLERLIACPGRELHVTALVGLEEPDSDAGPVLDARAKASYKLRLEDLTDELHEARRFDDAGRAERAQREIDLLTQQLRAAVGLCGRDRKAGSLAERARVNVQRRIRVALKQIGAQDPTLGRYLIEAVKTGFFCVFKPS